MADYITFVTLWITNVSIVFAGVFSAVYLWHRLEDWRDKRQANDAQDA